MPIATLQKARGRVHRWRLRRRFGYLFDQAERRADPGPAAALAAAIDWLCLAQDRSPSADGGVARSYSPLTGWDASYPETTGYIAATLLDCIGRCDRDDLADRVRRMLDWLVAIQLAGGGYPGGTIDRTDGRPVIFNTGQVLIGLARGAGHFRDPAITEAMHRTARFLVAAQDDDGPWRRRLSPYTRPGPKAYHTHVAWGLLEAARVAPDDGYAPAALAHCRWALTCQRPNGWFADCCINHPSKPLTHTIGYTLRGLIEAWRFTGQDALLAACRRTADGLLAALRADGFLPGRLTETWTAAADWACLTGSAQVAECLLRLHAGCGDPRYLDAGRRITAFLRRLAPVDGPPETRGAVAGAWPLDAAYERNCFPNWAAKFFADAQLLEMDLSLSRRDASRRNGQHGRDA